MSSITAPEPRLPASDESPETLVGVVGVGRGHEVGSDEVAPPADVSSYVAAEDLVVRGLDGVLGAQLWFQDISATADRIDYVRAMPTDRAGESPVPPLRLPVPK